MFEIYFLNERFEKVKTLDQFYNTVIDCAQLCWRDWRALELNKETLLTQNRRFLKHMKVKWYDNLEKLYLGALSKRDLVDLNKYKTFYYLSGFKTDEFGHTSLINIKDDLRGERYFPIFTSREECETFLKREGIESQIYRSRLIRIMKMLDENCY